MRSTPAAGFSRPLALCIVLLAFFPATRVRADTPPAPPLPPLVQRLIATIEKARSLSVDFQAAEATGGTTETVRIVWAKPNKVKILTRSGGLVSDGGALAQWEGKQIRRQPAASSFPALLPELDDRLSPDKPANFALYLLTNPEAFNVLPELHDEGLEAADGVPSRRFATQGHVSEGDLTLWLAASSGLPVRAAFQYGAQRFTVHFGKYQIGRAVPGTEFAAAPPAGLSPPPGDYNDRMLAPGTPAPDFTLTTLAGKTETLSALKGHVVLLDFWYTYGGPPAASLPLMQKVYVAFGRQGLTVLPICSWEKRPDFEAFWSRHPAYTLPSLFDPALSTASVASGKYFAPAVPTFYLIDRRGRVADWWVGYEGAERVQSERKDQRVRQATAALLHGDMVGYNSNTRDMMDEPALRAALARLGIR